jgi:hypothetical protein
MVEIWLNGTRLSMLMLAAWGKDPEVGQPYTHLGKNYTVSKVSIDPKTKNHKIELAVAA